MNILLLGSTGQMGQALAQEFQGQHHVLPLSHGDADIADFIKVKQLLRAHRPDVVVNTAAYHRVAECEANVRKSFFINGFCVKHLALCCKKSGAALMHFSTDYVFDGGKKTPYGESDKVMPVNVYGLSKLAGELFIRRILPSHFIIRVSGLFGTGGSRQKGGNFLTQILSKAQKGEEIAVVDDMRFSPTYTPDAAKVLRRIISACEYGTYHVTNRESCSWHEFAAAFFKNLKMRVKMKAVAYENLNACVRRPMYSVLENAHVKRVGVAPARHWKEALKDYCGMLLKL